MTHQAVFEPGRGVSQAEFEGLICGRSQEIVSAYDPSGKQAFPPLEGEAERVALPPAEKVDLRDTTLVHNHPEFRTLSPGDLRVAALRTVRSIVAVLPDRTALRLVVPDPENWPVEELLERNYEAWASVAGALGGRLGGAPTDELHRTAIEAQRRLFSEIGVILRHDRLGS